MRAFDFDGDKYKAASAKQKEWGARLIDELELTGTETVLDLGCGDGLLTEQLARRVPRGHVVGVDASPGMIRTARRIQRDNLEFTLMDINDLQFDRRFDAIVSNAALHWVIDHESLLPKVCALLAPGGVARFNFAADGNCPNLIRITREAMREPAFSSAFEDFAWPWFMPTVESYAELADRAGFSKTHAWEEVVESVFPDAEAMIHWLDQPSLVPFLVHVDAETGSSFRREIVNRMLEATRRDDRTFLEPFRRIHLRAVR